jgi:hypothetical protein
VNKTDSGDSEFRMESRDLYREEVFTDRRVGTVRRLIPVTPSGAPDPSRKVLHVGQAQLLTPVGAIPLSFEIEAASLEDAVAAFGRAAQRAAEQAIEELRELRREAASSIVIPESGVGGVGGIGGPRGGKIQIP